MLRTSPSPASLRVSFAAGQPVLATVRLREELAPATRAGLERLGFGRCDRRRPRDESVVGQALVTRLLEACCGASHAGMAFGTTPAGKPFVRLSGCEGSPAPGISLSHSQGLVVAAACRTGEIGVDIEPVRPVPWRSVERVFAEPDRRRLRALPAPERERAFAGLWTVAEACAKAAGDGSRLLLSGLEPLGLGYRGRWRAFRWACGFLDPTVPCAVAVDRALQPQVCLAAPAEVDLDWLVHRDG